MPRILIKLAYVGTAFNGWQIQNRGRSVQACVEQAIQKICKVPVRVHASGRTDSGVHALGQVAHFDVDKSKALIPWAKALNTMLPEDISVLEARVVSPDFHARFSATSKKYAYTFWTGKEYILPQRNPYVWQVWDLDLQAMQRSASFLEGEHDFACFQNSGTEVKSTVRNIYKIWVEPGIYEQEMAWYFHGSGFLKQMVRNIVGFLKCVGKGQLSPDQALVLLKAKDRRLAPATAPARGLCLEKVYYDAF